MLRKHLLVLFIVPFFFVAFSIGYRPFDMFSLCDFGFFKPPVHIVLLGCIILVMLLLSRTVYFFVERHDHFHWWADLIWCLAEIFIISFFTAMYMSLFAHRPYFECLGLSLQFNFTILIYPYAILCLADALVYRVENTKYSQAPENVIHFHDENKHLKLVVSASSVLYIKANDNSVNINYLESGRVKDFALRTSMRSLEPIAERFHLVRCQRSYYVNPAHVKVLRKDSDGFIFADLGIEGVNPIPVSKTYYDNIAAIL